MDSLSRSSYILGESNLAQLKEARVIIFGVGGVGSWCCEALVRTGVGHITIVDPDKIAVSNINRQLQATLNSVNEVKVEALKRHLLTINRDVEIETLEKFYSSETSREFNLDSYDYVIDAIDSLQSKLDLIIHASNSKATLFSSLGAACKVDPTRVKVADISKSFGCKLGRVVRKGLHRRNFSGKFKVVFSDELIGDCSQLEDDKQVNGSLLHITGIFGFNLASLVINDICENGTPLTRLR